MINFIIGAFLKLKFDFDLVILLMAVTMVFATALFLFAYFGSNNNFNNYSLRNYLDLENTILILVVVAFFFLGFYRYGQVSKTTLLDQFYNQRLTVIGEIYGEVSLGASANRYKIKIFKITEDNKIIYPAENLIISTYKYPEYHSGQVVRVTGQLSKPKNFENDNGVEFDYVNYLRKDGIHGILGYTQIEVLEEEFKIDYVLFQIKYFFLMKISEILTSPEAEYMGGLLLGVKQSLGDQLEKEFRIAGLIHAVVLSGYNITIIIVAVFKFLSFLPSLYKYLVGLIFVAMFAIMVGSGATVVRASLMAFLMIFSKVSNRHYDVNRALFFAGLVMIIRNPLIIFFDPSFQLSFVASLGLINLSPHIKKLLVFVTEKFEAREIVSASVSTQIAVLPMILNMSGELSVVSLPANLIVLPLIPVTMLLGFIVGILSVIFKPAALLIGFFANILLNFQLKVVSFFANLPFAVVNVKQLESWQIFLFYSTLVIILYFRPIQIFKKIFHILPLSTRVIIRHK